jgi:enterochelin esterase-like enzyme
MPERTVPGSAGAVDEAVPSPRLARLQASIAASGASALEEFWQETSARTGPLVEHIDGDDTGSMLLTFLWREDEPLENVVVFGGPGGWAPARTTLDRLDATDVWHRSYRVPSTYRCAYVFAPNDPLTGIDDYDGDELERMKTWRRDPFNPETYVVPNVHGSPERGAVCYSVVALPDAPAQPWTRATGRPAGDVETHDFRSAILGDSRRIFVYTPPDWDDADEPCPLLIVFDGSAYVSTVPTPTILDNAIAAGAVPPLIAVMVDSVENRDVELPCHAPFVEFLTDELLPSIRTNWNVRDEARHTTVAGSSYGGLAAAYAAYQRPDVFGNVLSQSGAFGYPNWVSEKEHAWLIRRYEESPRLPVRFYLDVGLFERGSYRGLPSFVDRNREMRDVLRGKGYEVHYAEFAGGHQYICWQGTLGDGLIAILGRHDDERHAARLG